MKIHGNQNEKKLKTGLSRRSSIVILFFIIFGAIFSIFPHRDVKAVVYSLGEERYIAGSGLSLSEALSLSTFDKSAFGTSLLNALENIGSWALDRAWQEAEKLTSAMGSKALKQATYNALNKMAYDSAVWIASGNRGQKPMFIREGWVPYLTNIADEAAGDFIESIGEQWGNYNLCEPDAAIKIRIGLGLVAAERPGKPKCTFSEMKNNWEEELTRADFLPRFQEMFNPTSNSLGMALILQTGVAETTAGKQEAGKYERLTNKGWLDITDLAGRQKNTPGYGESRLEMLQKLYGQDFGKFTGYALVDAANVFLNQLAIELFWNLMGSLGEGGATYTSPYSGDYGGLLDYANGSKGVKEAKESFRYLLEPRFKVRGDYNILSELTMCPDPAKAGPTNCVIAENFRQAVSEKKTVGQALSEGSLNAGGIFGFTANGLEPNYLEGYPYRSLIILRKFRIIPVGWEVAAQYIKDHGAELGKALNISDLVACFDPGDEYGGYEAGWCQGLVDPRWVLKAPLNYCAREGAGPEIISERVVKNESGSSLAITRNNNYCADEQTCIKEGKQGSCDLYGYCTEEKRTWSFDSDSCEPRYNTCQTFRSRSGQTVSYLENTLDFSGCSAETVGCKGYCADISYQNGSVNFNCTEAGGNKNYLNKQVKTCNQSEEGCHEFIRAKAGVGANLIKNSSFEIAGNLWSGTVVENESFHGNKALKNPGGSAEIETGAVSGETFVFSVYAKDCAASDKFTIGGSGGSEQALAAGANWRRYEKAYTYPAGASGNTVDIIFSSSGDCLIDAVKLERGNAASAYSQYGESGVIYQKLLPSYLKNTCYEIIGGERVLKENAPAICANYATFCSAKGAGCEIYTSTADDFRIPARVSEDDRCSAECVGYNSFIQKGTMFENSVSASFIPATARTCNAEAIGCDEFTNLDEVARGGEGREYYTQLRECQKPDTATCAEFYTWEGSEESGFQLKVFSLKKNGDAPFVTDVNAKYQGKECNDSADYDPVDNPMCREFYNRQGQVYYRFFPYVVFCSEDCHPYRRTIDDTTHLAIPNQGIACSADQAGCREYTGSAGENFQIIARNDFEDGGTGNWQGSDIQNSAEAIYRGGHSLKVNGEARLPVGSLVKENGQYILEFLAKGSGNLSVKLSNGSEDAPFEIGSGSLSNDDWRLFKLNLRDNFLNHAVNSNDEKLIISAGSFYLDDIKLKEIQDRYYLIKNSWVTPDECDGKEGCAQYRRESDNTTHYLFKFSNLCQESEAGCEAMVDTKNTSADQGDDEMVYVSNKPAHRCGKEAKGCELLGEPEIKSGLTSYKAVYLKNDPEAENIKCESDDEWCEEYGSENGSVYFKDPGGRICEWRTPAESKIYGWYKERVKKCDNDGNGVGEGNVCEEDGDCQSGKLCREAEEEACLVSDLKTFGYGGPGNKIYQPDNYWAGLCPSGESGCSEIIDPASQFSPNLIFNPDYKDLDGNGSLGDGWKNNRQTVKAEKWTLYTLKGDASVSCGSNVYELAASSNELSEISSVVAGAEQSARFYTADQDSCEVTRNSGSIELRKTVVDYQLKTQLNYQACNGVVDFKEGCILFNQRSQEGNNKLALKYDSDTKTLNNCTGDNCDANVLLKVAPDRVCAKWLACRSMVAVKNESGEEEKVCFDIGLCDNVDENGQCSNFLLEDQINQTYSDTSETKLTPEKVSNLAGYSKVGWEGSSLKSDFYPLGEMKQVGEVSRVPNGDFEIAGTNNYPIGWTPLDFSTNPAREIGWNETIFKAINDPAEAKEKEKIGYAPEGGSFLKVGSVYGAVSEFIEVEPETDYILTAYLNTLNLIGAAAKIKIVKYNSAGNVSGEEFASNISLEQKNDWTFKLGKFRLEKGVKKIKLILLADGSPTGRFYFDDIRINPALEVQEINTTDRFYKTQSCRLYPSEDSLSCDYYDDSGMRYKGWPGYCLENDRTPGTSDSCLLWWPVNKVKGDGVEEGAGYDGRFPLYYTTEVVDRYVCATTTLVGVPKDKEYSTPALNCDNFDDECDSGRVKVYFMYNPENTVGGYHAQKELSNSVNFGDYGYTFSCSQGGVKMKYIGNNGSPSSKVRVLLSDEKYDWFCPLDSYYPELIAISAPCGAEATFDEDIRQETPKYYASKIVQTVTPTGQNKFWSGRVYEGSSFLVPCNNGIGLGKQTNRCDFLSDYYPFGSTVYPSPASNPYEWDSKTDPGIQPLYYELPDESLSKPYQPRAGQLLNTDSAKRLFAQSYDEWIWGEAHYCSKDSNKPCASDEECASGTCITANRYIRASSSGWSPPDQLCGGSRPDYPNDYCAIAPRAGNIKVNSTGDLGDSIELYPIVKNSFAHLTFTTEIDSQQLPLVMYEVDWGDKEKTVVSGVEMRDRRNVDNPHSLYHLYNYWDLKKKRAQGTAGIVCDGNDDGIAALCPTADHRCCGVRPKIKIKDNWDWCNNDTTRGQCNSYTLYGGWVVVAP